MKKEDKYPNIEVKSKAKPEMAEERFEAKITDRGALDAINMVDAADASLNHFSFMPSEGRKRLCARVSKLYSESEKYELKYNPDTQTVSSAGLKKEGE